MHGGLTAEGGRTAEAGRTAESDNAAGLASLCPCATGLELTGTAQDWDQSQRAPGAPLSAMCIS